GDITDFGVLEQYLTIYNILKKLHVPYISVIGNHDLTANGGKIYLQMFGEKNFSFIYKGYKFLFHDTNGREYDFNGSVPNLFWMTDQLKDEVPKWFVGVSHVPPFDPDFDKTLELPYKDLLLSKPNFILSLHGHTHHQSDSYKYEDHVRYMTCNSVEKQKSCLLKLINGKVMMQLIPY
ncbi:MAG: metallophosphoesterase, partial [Sphingobacteriales bacterium]|nr:metallophosphoesterase [Sphingobacteriales bacterium]